MTLEVHSVKLNSNADMQSSSLPGGGDQQEDKSRSSITSGPTSSSSTSRGQYQPDLCPVCQAPSLSSCRTCKKISYCSKGHQRSHWKVHKIDCFPLLQQEDEILGRRLIATRNIKQGEIILREKPLISGPKLILPEKKIIGDSESPNQENKSLVTETSSFPDHPVAATQQPDHPDPQGNKSICLGCFDTVKTNYTCPSCSWPVCGQTCAENAEHKENECEIFASHQVPPFVQVKETDYNYEYEAITVLRGVLLKDRDPSKWKELVKLNIEMEKEITSFGDSEECEMCNSPQSGPSCFLKTFTCSSSNPKYPSECLEFCKSFLHNICKLTQSTEHDIHLLLTVMRTSSIPLNNDDHLPGEDLSRRFPSCGGLHLCTRARMAVQSCVPNSSLVIQSVPHWEMCLRAIVPIQIGERVTLSHANDVTAGIMTRGRNLSKIKCRTCCPCKRCTDPTEIETFFSAIKCPKKHSSSPGYFLPMVKASRFDTVGESHVSHWKCSECSDKVTSDFYEQTLLPLKLQWCSTIKNKENSPDVIEKLSEMCLNFQDSTLHPNHYFVYEMEMDIVRRIARNLNSDGWSSVDEQKESFVSQMIQICRKWLEIAEVVWKGLTRQRGMILYFLQEGMTRAMIMNISVNMRNHSKADNCELTNTKKNEWEKDFNLILNMRKEILQIFCLDPPGSVGQAIAQFMVQMRPELLVLRRYFLLSATQNSNGISL